MFNYYFNIGLIYLIIGFSVALLFSFVFRKKFLGNFWGALLVAVIGAFLGGIVEFFFQAMLQTLTQLAGSINVLQRQLVDKKRLQQRRESRGRTTAPNGGIG